MTRTFPSCGDSRHRFVDYESFDKLRYLLHNWFGIGNCSLATSERAELAEVEKREKRKQTKQVKPRRKERKEGRKMQIVLNREKASNISSHSLPHAIRSVTLECPTYQLKTHNERDSNSNTVPLPPEMDCIIDLHPLVCHVMYWVSGWVSESRGLSSKVNSLYFIRDSVAA